MEITGAQYNYNEFDSEISQYLYRACHQIDWATERWQTRRITGLDDEGLREALGFEFGPGYGISGSGLMPMYCHGGAEPHFWCGTHLNAGKLILHGSALVDAVRKLLGIPYPSKKTAVLLQKRIAG